MKFEVFIAEYLLILLTIATILYITNEVIKLIDTIRIIWVEHRVRALCRERTHETTKKEIKAKQIHRSRAYEFAMPKFNWKWLWVAFGVVATIILAYGIIGIIMYDPSGGRG